MKIKIENFPEFTLEIKINGRQLLRSTLARKANQVRAWHVASLTTHTQPDSHNKLELFIWSICQLPFRLQFLELIRFPFRQKKKERGKADYLLTVFLVPGNVLDILNIYFKCNSYDNLPGSNYIWQVKKLRAQRS